VHRTIPARGSVLQEWTEPFRVAPLFALALLLYMGLPSSMIFPEGNASVLSAWHLAYPGWYDLAYLLLAVGGLALSRRRPPSRAVLICVMFLVPICISSLFSGTQPTLANDAFLDALLYWLRFSVTFVCAAALTEKNGVNVTSQIMFVVGLLLMASSVFVFRLQYPDFNRVYASGMTVGSFGQVLLILFVVAMIRNHIGMMLISLVFLILTFSRTDLLLWMASLGYFLLTRSKIRLSRRALYGGLVAVLFVASTVILLRYPEFQFVINERLDPDDILTMNRRTQVFQYGTDLLLSKSVPLFGIGFNCTPSVLLDFTSISVEDPTQALYFPSFHSILFEYAVGLGVLSIPIFAFLLWRIGATWWSRSYLPFYIYSLFVLSQSFDFSFNRPKEVIIWGAFLGLAEGVTARERKATSGWRKASRPIPFSVAQTPAEPAASP
jgi:hypothetical protein